MGPYGGLNSEKIHKIRTATCSTITYKTKKNNKTVREVKLRKCLNSKVTGLISTLCWRPALASVSRFAASSKRLMAPSDERRELVFSSVKNWRERKVHFRGSKG